MRSTVPVYPSPNVGLFGESILDFKLEILALSSIVSIDADLPSSEVFEHRPIRFRNRFSLALYFLFASYRTSLTVCIEGSNVNTGGVSTSF
jgi:hypothetical protein